MIAFLAVPLFAFTSSDLSMEQAEMLTRCDDYCTGYANGQVPDGVSPYSEWLNNYNNCMGFMYFKIVQSFESIH